MNFIVEHKAAALINNKAFLRKNEAAKANYSKAAEWLELALQNVWFKQSER